MEHTYERVVLDACSERRSNRHCFFRCIQETEPRVPIAHCSRNLLDSPREPVPHCFENTGLFSRQTIPQLLGTPVAQRRGEKRRNDGVSRLRSGTCGRGTDRFTNLVSSFSSSVNGSGASRRRTSANDLKSGEKIDGSATSTSTWRVYGVRAGSRLSRATSDCVTMQDRANGIV